MLVSVGLLVAIFGGYLYIVLAEPGKSDRTATLVPVPNPPDLSSPGTASAGTTSTTPAAGSASRPARLLISAIGLSSVLSTATLDKAGILQPPADPGKAGWYPKGVLPGQPGPAVIAGQVDAATGPGVFFRLRDLRLGDLITVQRQDGGLLHFEVDDIHSYPRAPVPSSAIFGQAAVPTLRLVSCPADPASNSYLQNLVVSAHLS